MHGVFSFADSASSFSKIIKTTMQTFPEDALSQTNSIKSFEKEAAEINEIFNRHVYAPNNFLSTLNKPHLKFEDHEEFIFKFDKEHFLAMEATPKQLRAMKEINERVRRAFRQRLSLASSKALLISEHAADKTASILFCIAINLLIYTMWLAYPILSILGQMELGCVCSIIGALISLPFEYSSVKNNLIIKAHYKAKKEEDAQFDALIKELEGEETLTEEQKAKKDSDEWKATLENYYLATARIAERIMKTSFGWARAILSICLLCMPMTSPLGAFVFYLGATLAVVGAILPLFTAAYYMWKSFEELRGHFKKPAFDKKNPDYYENESKQLRKKAYMKFWLGIGSNITNIAFSILSLATFFIILSNPWVIIGLALVAAALIHLRNYLYAKSNEFKIESSREECMSSISYKDERTLHYYDTKLNVHFTTNVTTIYNNCNFFNETSVTTPKIKASENPNQLTDGSSEKTDEEKLQELIEETQKIAAWTTTEAFRKSVSGEDIKATSLRDLYKLKHRTTEVSAELTQSKTTTRPKPNS